MKTLANHQLIYDKDCPLCNLYSGAFVKTKMLDKNGRQNFRDLSTDTKSFLNVERAKNEIALVNFKNKNVHYGLDSLLIIIGNSFPILEKIGRIPFVYWFFTKLYSLVSYNRKQIIPSKNDTLENACVPDFNVKYRMVFLISGVLFSSFLLSSISSNFGFQIGYLPTIFIILGIFLIQISLILKNRTEKIFNYLGNLNTILMVGSLIPAVISWLNLPLFVNKIFLISVLILVLIEYFRRIRILK